MRSDETFKLLNPKIDVVFRALFTSPKRGKECLLSFINSSLIRETISDIEILDGTLLPEMPRNKFAVLDIKAKDAKGKKYNIEMQISAVPSMVPRVLYYWAKLYTQDLQKGEDYQELTPTISIIILNWNLLASKTKYHHVYELQERDTHDQLTDHLEIHFLELEKLRTQQSSGDLLSAWLLFFKDPNGPWKDKIMAKNQAIKTAYNELEAISHDPKIRTLYEWQEKAEHDIASRERASIEKGRAEGRMAAIHEIARIMKAEGQNIELIAKVTKLSIKEIKKLE